MSVPIVVIDSGPGAARVFEAERAAISADGWRVVTRIDARARGRCVMTGTVANQSDAAAALLAALDGHGLLILAQAERIVVERLVDDLSRIGSVRHCTGEATAMVAPVDPGGRTILRLLADGRSLGEAAHLLGLSRRTADRRLADARRALGVNRTTEAIAKAVRLGWLDPVDPN